MNPLQLLNWLWQRANDVIDFFANWYRKAREAAYKAFSWAWEEAQKAFNKAVEWITYVRNEIVNWVYAQVAWLIDFTNGLVAGARQWFGALVEALNRQLSDLAAYVGSIRLPSLNDIINAVRQLWNPAFNWLNDKVSYLLSQSAQFVKQNAPIFKRVENLLRFFDSGGFAKTIDNLQRQINNLIPLINDLPGTIIAAITDDLWELLQYVVAYELGALEDDLPPFPDFGKRR